MGKLFPIVGVIVLFGVLFWLVTANENLGSDIQADYTEAERLVREFGNSGEEIVFYLDPQPPTSEYTYVEKEVEKQVYNNATGKVETVTEIEFEKVPTSEVTVYSRDRQTGDTKVCKRGNQCDITGEMTLIDPITGLVIDPPYGYFLSIECIEARDPAITSCQSFSSRADNKLTYGDKSFKYSFTTNLNDPIGTYSVQISVTSKFKVADPDTGLERPVVRDGFLDLELIE